MQKSSFKDQILSQLLDTYATTLGALKQNQASNRADSSALFLPPDAPGSVGDEAMLAAGMKHLAEQGIKRIGIVAYKAQERWDNLPLVTETIHMEGHFFYNSWRERFRFAQLVNNYDRFYCIGADVMDGYYAEVRTLCILKLVALAAKTRVKTTILGFSFNQQPTPSAVKALTELPPDVRICARDPFSYQRLTQYLTRPVNLVADVGFMLQPAVDSAIALQVSEWTRAQKNAGRLVLGVNANSIHQAKMTQLSMAEFIQLYANTLAELHSKFEQISFLLIPHDFRGKHSDAWLAQEIAAALPPEVQPHCLKVPTPCSAAEIKAICADLDLAITGRMHLAIACLGQGVPAAGITYQGKFEGLYNHFELSGMTLEPETAFLQPGALVGFLAELIARREQIRQQVQSQLPKVKALSLSNFDSKTVTPAATATPLSQK